MMATGVLAPPSLNPLGRCPAGRVHSYTRKAGLLCLLQPRQDRAKKLVSPPTAAVLTRVNGINCIVSIHSLTS
jgi:hypothetical protein